MKKTIAKLLVLVLTLGILSACGGKDATEKVGVGEAKYGSEYPIESDVTLTWWMPMSANISTSAANFGDLPVAKELEKRTGIKVKFIHPSLNNSEEKFNLMVASGDLPDIISYRWEVYPGGPGKAVSDKIILPLDDYINAYAPNLKKLYDENPELAKLSKTENGQYFSAGLMRNERKQLTTGGLIIRQDWLDDLNLEMPETIDEWHTVLTAFKEKKGAKAPLSIDMYSFETGAFCGAYGVNTTFFHDEDGKVYYGPAENGYKEFLTTLNKWYDEGLFDNNFSTTDGATIKANMLNGNTGVMYGGLGGTLGALVNASTDPAFKVTGAPYPTHKKGEKPMFGQAAAASLSYTAITTKCKDTELAMKLLDYAYSEEGHLFYNFGVEGETYNMIDGYPTYTELITKNPDGLSMSQALTKYCFAGQMGGYLESPAYLEQYAGLPEQQEAWERWMNTDGDKYVMPYLYTDPAKQTEFASKMTDIQTYVDEMFIKFVSGIEPIEKFDSYVSQLKKLGIDDILAMKQEAYNKFLAN